jgi:hypothetical protein
MTKSLAWPIAPVMIGLIFTQSIISLLQRVRRLTWRESAAELAETTEDVQNSIEEAVKLLPVGDQIDEETGERVRRRRIEQLMENAARWGFQIAR